MRKIFLAYAAMVLAAVFVMASMSVVIAPAPSQPTVSASIVLSGSPVLKDGDTLTLYVYVKNINPVANAVGGGLARDKIPNAYVVSQMTLTYGDPSGGLTTIVETPDGTPYPHQVNRWPQTVYNVDGALSLGSPAILPGENTVLFTIGWLHPADGSEANGKWPVTCTIDGTINGTPLTISAHTLITTK
jgi:hypothetical protein